MGTATLNMQQLLRQGREFSELLIEVPIMDQSQGGSPPPSEALLGQSTLGGRQGGGAGAGGETAPTVLSKGSIVLRIVNIGREPRNPGAGGWVRGECVCVGGGLQIHVWTWAAVWDFDVIGGA